MFPACAALALVGCQGANPTVDQLGLVPEYRSVQTRLLDGDLVNFLVEARGALTTQDVTRYAECAAAQYALIRGYGFARHVRTNVNEEGGVWRGDAVYTISPALPGGLKTIDAEVVVARCRERGIPTV
ncbi:hypothetical protein [Oceaniglobus indicus]|uniref:hypothetical protein n=1 Tax=Oceaniglobus indicus TaxID=2047749 RepID=UPI001F4E112E|nr:hypothetical protein [Oceaniglobus indicus]